MSLIAMKKIKENKLEVIDEHSFEKDRKEEHLQKIIEENPQLITWIFSGKTLVLSGRITLPSEKEPDVLLVTENGELVVVELKRGSAPREAIIQLIDYASSISTMQVNEFLAKTRYTTLPALYDAFGLENDEEKKDFEKTFEETMKKPQFVLVSYSIGDDVKRIVDWARENSKLMIYCVEFDYFRKEELGLEFFVPQLIGFEKTIELRNKTLNDKQKVYYGFFSKVSEKFRQEKPGVTNRVGTVGSWMSFSSEHKGIHFEWTLAKKEPNKEIMISLDFELPDKAKNQKLLEKFKANKNAYEKKIGRELFFNDKFGKNWARVGVSKKIGGLNKAEENIDWTAETMKRFYEALKPDLDTFCSELKLE